MKPFIKNNNSNRPIESYERLRTWRNEQIEKVKDNHFSLNQFHDELISKVVSLSVEKIESEQGIPPARFAFFVTGSAGRFEQSIWSDQDHGIIFEGKNEHEHLTYFLALGDEIVKGLNVCGYEECDGKVMANNPLWCRSTSSWQRQVSNWLENDSWENLRNTSIFIDSRVLIGDKELLEERKRTIFDIIDRKPLLLERMADNIENRKKGVGWFGQLLPVQKGPNKGMLDFKLIVLFPFVNAMRLLSYAEKITESSTLSRFQQLSDYELNLAHYEQSFCKALEFRLEKVDPSHSYEEIHFIDVEQLTKTERQRMKKWMKEGSSLVKYVMDHSRQKARDDS